VLRLRYADGRGILRTVLQRCTQRGWSVQDLAIARETLGDDGDRVAAVTLQLAGRGDLAALATELAEVEGVRSARTGHEDAFDEEE
jgi:putative Mg2+ transporter-C (MgtC) family protein